MDPIQNMVRKECSRIASLLLSDIREHTFAIESSIMGHEVELRAKLTKTLMEEIGDILEIPKEHDKDCRVGQEIEIGMIEECSCGKN